MAKMRDRRAGPADERRDVFDEGGLSSMARRSANRALLDRLNVVNRDLGLAEMPALDP
jgi:hypothetical protein